MKTTYEKVLEHATYQDRLAKLALMEEQRVFCKHDLEHSLEVARIALQVARGNDLQISEDVIKTTALLHDMGRVEQYEQGVSHVEASVAFAREILLLLDTDNTMIDVICDAIQNHSRRDLAKERFANAFAISTLKELISHADQFSRKCYMCRAYDACKWHPEEKIQKEYYEDRKERV